MIGMLSGRLAERGQDHVLIDVGGVGYIVHVSERTLAALPGIGEAVRLYTDLLVREDLLQLFGFPSAQEREWHRLLMSVQGVGARASMGILGALGVERVERAIALGDWNAVKVAPGVGPKIAQRVVHELKGKAPAAAGFAATGEGPAPVSPMQPASGEAGTQDAARAEALSALANLGYAPTDAHRAVAEALDEASGAETGTLIRLALRRLAPAG